MFDSKPMNSDVCLLDEKAFVKTTACSPALTVLWKKKEMCILTQVLLGRACLTLHGTKLNLKLSCAYFDIHKHGNKNCLNVFVYLANLGRNHTEFVCNSLHTKKPHVYFFKVEPN